MYHFPLSEKYSTLVYELHPRQGLNLDSLYFDRPTPYRGQDKKSCRINLLLSPRPKSQQRRPGASLPLLRLQRPRCRGCSRCVIPSSETRTHKRRNARGQGAAPQGQEENICGFEGVLGPSRSAPPSRDPLPPPFSSWSVYISSPRRLLQKRAGKGMLIPQLRSTGLALFRNFARAPSLARFIELWTAQTAALTFFFFSSHDTMGTRNRDAGAGGLGPQRTLPLGAGLVSGPSLTARTAEPPLRQACGPARQTVPGRPETYAVRRPRGPTWCSLQRRFSAHQKPRLSSAVWAAR
ncbi:uncharacterized protein LOC102997602 [Balaenoptera acutorostrata]|uniref:Uncharacterized protein LOC102997602 n=1 Tax=Balaenoptera acutorostrata TaxID=9767 RepID=A0A383ZTG4_BALAC|nr:uncharacterized protein LOC102997602 [Balaenoptera acutorostrata]